MSLIFPSNPTVGQTYQSGSSGTFVYNGEAWDSQNSNLPVTVSSASFSSLAATASFAQPSLQSFIDGGVITLGAVTTAPTKGSIATDRVYYRQVGPKQWEVIYNWYNNSGGTTGTGDYLLTLPNSLQFNSSALGQTFRTDVITGGQLNSGLGLCPGMLNTAYPLLTAVPYDATRFRILVFNASSGIPGFWSSTYGPLSQLSIFKLNFTFTAL